MRPLWRSLGCFALEPDWGKRVTALVLAPRTRRAALLLTSLVGGIGFGALILWAEHGLTYPWAILGNSTSLWGLLAFVVGYSAARPRSGALYGALTLVVGLLGFYLAAAALVGAAIADVWSAAAIFWYFAGVVVGAFAGLGGAWASTAAGPAKPAIGWAFPVALLWSEALVRASDRGVGTGPGSAGILFFVGFAVLSLGIAHLARRALRMVAAVLAAAVIFSTVGYVLYRAVGIRHLA